MTEEEQKEFEKKWKEAEAGGQATKAQSAQLICIPGNVPYRIREYLDPENTADKSAGEVIVAPAAAGSIAAIEGLTTSEATPIYLHFPYNAGSDNPIIPHGAPNFRPLTSDSIDLIRNDFFSFFDDRRAGDYMHAESWAENSSGAQRIALKKQAGGTWGGGGYWEKMDIGNPDIKFNNVSYTLQSEYTLGGGAWNGRLRYFKPTAYASYGTKAQLIEMTLPGPDTWADEKKINGGGYYHTVPGSSPLVTLCVGSLGNPESCHTHNAVLAYIDYKSAGGQSAGESVKTIFGAMTTEDIIAITNAVDALQNQSFFDGTFVLNKPFVEKAYSEALGEKIGLSDPVKVQAHYNFYLVPYENITKDNTNIPIGSEPVLLPNLYGIMVDAKNENNNGYMFKHADNWQYHTDNETRWGKITTDPAEAAKYGTKVKWGSFTQPGAGGSKQIDTHNEYLNKFAMKLKESATAEDWSSQKSVIGKKKYNTTGLSAYQLKDFMDEADGIKKFFPMYANIEIPASNKGKFGKMLYDADMFDQFMQLMMAVIHPQPGNAMVASTIKTAIVKKDSTISSVFENLADANKPNVVLSQQQDSLYYEPLIAIWLNKFLEQDSMPDVDSVSHQDFKTFVNSTDLTLSNPKAHMATANEHNRPFPVFGKKSVPVNWINNIKWALNKNKIWQFIKEKTRSVSDIYEGKLAHSEVLFYEIVKFHRTPKNTSDTFIQNIFLPNAPGLEVLKYVDTQVKFGQEYYYQVYAHTLVVGTQYETKNAPQASPNDEWSGPTGASNSKYLFDYKFAPSIHLMRVPYYNTYVTMAGAVLHGFNPSTNTKLRSYYKNELEATPIWDKPPVFPDIVFHPLYGEKNKILINSNFNVGEYDLEPIPVDGKEQENLDVIRRNQKKLEGPVTFRGDDFCGHIEVLRIEKKPLAYSDFSPTENTKIAILGGTSHFGEIIEQEPNKEYYYMARAIDKHGNYSNPSPIYQARIVAREGEAPYTIFNMFFIEEVEEKKPIKRKNLMKYIRIQPSFDQSFLDSNQASIDYSTAQEFENNASLEKYLGTQVDKTVFGEKFKFRFTSKKTGKKFDLNVQVQNVGFKPGENKSASGEQENYSSGKC